MAEDKQLAVRQTAVPATEGMSQLVPMDGEVQAKNLAVREVVATLDPAVHFYNIEVWEDGGKKQQSVMSLEGKMLLAGLAGADITSQIDETTASREYVRATAQIRWRGPDGLIHGFERDREYDVALEYHKSLLKKATQCIYQLKPSGNKPGNPKLYAEIERVFQESENPEEAMAGMINKIVPMEDLLRLRTAQLEIRTHLRALCRSKAISQALTEFLRYVGARLKYTGAIGGKVEVKLINTLDVTQSGEDGMKMLYDGGDKAEVIDIVEERETAEIVQTLADSDVIAFPAGKIEIVQVDKTTGEVVEAPVAEPVAEIPQAVVETAPAADSTVAESATVAEPAPTDKESLSVPTPPAANPMDEAKAKGTLMSEAMTLVTEMHMTKDDATGFLKQVTGKTGTASLTVDECRDLVENLKAEKVRRAK